ncbi:MAG: glycogen debranching enzyme family protein [Burkholderiales bacterium]|nr:glycogen debranching enzyme family protein [Burkholderiales bacterium]
MASELGPQQEWLEADGLGGYASGTATGVRTRRYHALLLTATTPPTGRMVLVGGFDAWIETPAGRHDLSSQCYAPGVIGGDGAQHIEDFSHDPWPTWVHRCADGTRVQLEIFVARGGAGTCLGWRLLGSSGMVRLFVRPFLSGRDYHALHHCNGAFRFDADVAAGRVAWQPYADVPGVEARHNGSYRHDPQWYYRFQYEAERERGLDCQEDLGAPGIFEWSLAAGDGGDAVLVLAAGPLAASGTAVDADASALAHRLRDAERSRRRTRASPLALAADAYTVQRHSPAAPAGLSIIAGYPWFADWGRDTFISMRGLCLATGRLDVARQILLAWAATVSEGMLPNRFPDRGNQPEFNAVDASLWFVIAVGEFLASGAASAADRQTLAAAVQAILTGYANGTRHGIRADADGLLACGEAGVQLTWMDAKVGDWVVTPRIGKPVEVQALWLNALALGSRSDDGRWQALFDRGIAAFRQRFWNAERGCLFDVVDADHRSGVNDAALRPNQIFAVGGLPLSLLDDARARSVVDIVEAQLWTPAGLRSLAPGEPGYAPHYEGGVRERDAAYHQGTVWPWLAAAFVEAWMRVRGNGATARAAARDRFLPSLQARLEIAGLGHLGEIADGDAPHTPRGCPFQAWSVGELLRLERKILAEPAAPAAMADPART